MSELSGNVDINTAFMRLSSIGNELAQIDARKSVDMIITCVLIILLGGIMLALICAIICDVVSSNCGGMWDEPKPYIIVSVIILAISCIIGCILVNNSLEAERQGLLIEKEMLEAYLRANGYL